MQAMLRRSLFLLALCATSQSAFHISLAQAQRAGLTSVPAEIPALDLQALVDDAKAKKSAQLKIAAGVYRVTTDTIKLTGLKNFVIDGTGATLLFPNPKAWAFSAMDSHDITLRGLTIDYDPLPFTQATITEKSPDGTWLNFRVHDGYPRLESIPFGSQCHAFDKTTRNWKVGVGDLYGQTKITSPSEGRTTFSSPPNGIDKLNVGDFVVFNTRGAGAVELKDSESIRMEDVTLLTSPGLGVAGRHMEGANYFRYTIKRGPRPAGASEDRLLSTGADGFNYADSRFGPTLEKCDFSFMGDDSVNLHGLSWPVLKVEGNAIWTAIFIGPRRYDSEFLPGDDIRFMSPDNFAVRSTGKMAVWEHNVPPDGLEITPELWKQIWPQRAVGGKTTFYKVVLKDPVDVKVGDFFDFPAANSPGYVIRDNYFHDHRARGLRIQSSDGLIEGNRFERLKGSAIAIGPELVYWREAGWPTKVTIRGNTIKDVGQGTNILQSDSFTPGAISLYTRLDQSKTHTFSSEIRNIQILDNVIDGSSVSGIHINASQNVTVRGNRISNVNTGATPRTGSVFSLNSANPITVQNSKNVELKDNVITTPVSP
jgi:hypothetical protein